MKYYHEKKKVWQPGEMKKYLATLRTLSKGARNRAEEDYQNSVIWAEREWRKRIQLESSTRRVAEGEALQRAGTHRDIFTVTEDLDQQYEDCIRAINVPLVIEGVHK